MINSINNKESGIFRWVSDNNPLPKIGRENLFYINMDNGALHVWNSKLKRYFQIIGIDINKFGPDGLLETQIVLPENTTYKFYLKNDNLEIIDSNGIVTDIPLGTNNDTINKLEERITKLEKQMGGDS